MSRNSWPHRMFILCLFAILLRPSSVLAFSIQPPQPSDYESYRSLVSQVIAEIDSGVLRNPAMAEARQDVITGLGVNIARNHEKYAPEDSRIIEKLISELNNFQTMSADQAESRWGDEGAGGDDVGIPMRSLPPFNATHSAMDVVFHPAKVRCYFKDYEKTQSLADLLDSRGELMEALHHLQVLEKEKDNAATSIKSMRIK